MFNNSSFRKFNIIDCIAAVIIVAAVAATLYYFTQKDGLFKKYKYPIEYEITVESIDTEFTNNLTAGDILYHQATAFELGTVKSVSSLQTDSRYSKMKIILSAEAEKHDGQLSVNGVIISEGKYIDFRTADLVYSGKCTSANILPEGDN